MKNFHSIKAIFIVGMLIVIALVMGIQSALSLYFFRSSMETKIHENLTNQAGQVQCKLDGRFNTLGKYTELLAYDISSMSTYDSNLFLNIIGKYIESDHLIYGTGVFFEPNVYQPGLKYYGPYEYKDDQNKIVLTWDYSNAKYDYLTQDWYTKGLATQNSVVWSDPYAELSDYVKSIKVGDTGYAFILARDGTYLASRDDSKNLKAKITDDKDAAVQQLGTNILQSNDIQIVKDDVFGANNFVVSTPVGDTGLHIVLVYPTSEAYAGFNHAIILDIVIFIIAVIILVLVL